MEMSMPHGPWHEHGARKLTRTRSTDTAMLHSSVARKISSTYFMEPTNVNRIIYSDMPTSAVVPKPVLLRHVNQIITIFSSMPTYIIL
jgi:hypothetical protein